MFARVQAEGLAARFRGEEDLRLSIKKLLALSFLPPEQIPEAFDQLKQQAERDILPVYRYFEDTYVRGRLIRIKGKGRRPREPPRHPPLFPPELWSVHGLQQEGLARTNNDQEAWHRRFNTVVGKCHIGVYPTIREFVKEQHRTEQELRRIDAGKKVARRVTKNTRAKEQRIQALFEEREELDLDTFLRRMARNQGFGGAEQDGQQEEDGGNDDD